MNYLENEFFLLAITFGIYFFCQAFYKKKDRNTLLNPILLTIAVIIIFLKLTNISFETYNQGGHLIEFWLKPAVVALGVPLYLQLETIKKQLLPIILSQLAGCIVGVISVVLIASLWEPQPGSHPVTCSKSVTTPIAMEVNQDIGWNPAPDSSSSCLCGFTGCSIRSSNDEDHACRAALSRKDFRWVRPLMPSAPQQPMDISSKYGAYASLGLTPQRYFYLHC